MIVTVYFSGAQRLIIGKSGIEISLTEDAKVNDALVYLRSKYPEFDLDNDATFIVINHEIVPADHRLQANDTISFVPAIGGG